MLPPAGPGRTVYGIVKQWGGYIAVESAPGAGTRFLEKPFTVPGLLQSVRAALDAGGEPAPE